jgi:hypothetical protein
VELTGIETDDETALWVEESALESMSKRNAVCETQETTDAQLESAIVAAVTAGAFDVAKTLAAQLEDRKKRAKGCRPTSSS